MAVDATEARLSLLENRLDNLERMLSERLALPAAEEKRGWKAIVGTFANDPYYEEAMRLGREWRKSDTDDFEDDVK